MKHILTGLLAALFSVPDAASAQLLTTGAGKASAAATPPPVSAINAVHFDWQNSALYTTSALTGPGGPLADTSKLTVSYVIRGVPNTAVQNNSGRKLTSGFVDLVSAIEAGAQGSETVPGQNTVYDTAEGPGTLRVNLTSTAGTQCQYLIAPTNVPPPQRSDYNVITYSFDGSSTTSSVKAMAVALNGVEIGSGGCASSGGTAAFLAGISNANGWLVANLNANTGQSSFDIAEVFVDFSHAIVDSSNHFVSGALAKFVDGNGDPVDTGADCASVFGSPPDLCFKGPAATFGTNKGTVTNTFTATGIMPASYNPGPVPAHQVRYIGAYGEAVAAEATTVTAIDTGMTILANDLIFQGIMLTDPSSSVDHNPACPSGYSLVRRQAPTSNTLMTSALCYRVATSNGEATTATWPTWTGAPDNGGLWFTAVFRGADPAAPIDDSASTDNGGASNTSTFVAPSVTATSGDDLLVNFVMGWFSDTFTIPAGETRELTLTGLGRNAVVSHFEPLSGAGATGARTLTVSRSDGGSGYSVALKPD
jgi:hypothetical protein